MAYNPLITLTRMEENIMPGRGQRICHHVVLRVVHSTQQHAVEDPSRLMLPSFQCASTQQETSKSRAHKKEKRKQAVGPHDVLMMPAKEKHKLASSGHHHKPFSGSRHPSVIEVLSRSATLVPKDRPVCIHTHTSFLQS